MRKLNCLLWIILICTVSCTNLIDNETIPEEIPPIIKLLDDFKKSHNIPSTKSTDFYQFNIINIKTETYSFEVGEKINPSSKEKIKSAKNVKNPNLLTVEIHTVEFENSGEKGFAIVTEDERINRVYAYTESGQLSDTTFNIGLRAAIHDIKIACEQDLLSYYNDDMKVQTASNRLIVQPITGLEWCQCAPYNQHANYCSSVRWDYVGRAPAGCTAVAIAQAVAYLCPPTLSSWNLSGLRNISSYAHGTTSAPWVSNMAVFLRNIGTCVKLNYGCDGSGAWIKEIRDEFDTWGIRYRLGIDVNVDIQSMAYNLYKGFPHITTGFTKKPRNGHTWLWEGIDCYYSSINSSTQKVNIVPNSQVLVYCNWGWGRTGGNGWYTQANMEQPLGQDKPYLDDNEQLYITGTSFTVPPRGQLEKYY